MLWELLCPRMWLEAVTVACFVAVLLLGAALATGAI